LFTNRNTPTKQRKVKTDGCLELSLNFIKPCAEDHYFEKAEAELVNPTDARCKIFPAKKKYLSKQDNAKWPNESNEEQEAYHPAE